MSLVLLQSKANRGRPLNSYAKHHITHASKNAASSSKGVFGATSSGKGIFGAAPLGKGILGAAPLGKGILGDGPPGKGFSSNAQSSFNRTGVVPPPSSYHHKPSAALYGNTSHMRKPAGGPVNSPRYGGGDGHTWKKPAVHAGILHAKRLPDKNITVRCTWSNNVDTSVRLVSSDQRTAPTQMYRAPTPPLSTIDTEYPAGCQDDVRRKLEQMHLFAAQKTSVLYFHFYI